MRGAILALIVLIGASAAEAEQRSVAPAIARFASAVSNRDERSIASVLADKVVVRHIQAIQPSNFISIGKDKAMLIYSNNVKPLGKPVKVVCAPTDETIIGCVFEYSQVERRVSTFSSEHDGKIDWLALSYTKVLDK